MSSAPQPERDRCRCCCGVSVRMLRTDRLSYISAVRIRPALIVFAVCLWPGLSVIVSLPEVASAEWKEDSWPCDVAPGAALSAPVGWYLVGEQVTPPAASFSDEESSEKSPPVSAFTATANWGDGTTSPATVVAGGVKACYHVSALGHAYASTGAYPFSFTVHDNETDLEHPLGATEFHIWSETPSPLGGPSSRTVHATVGARWSGVVGEFSYDGPNGFGLYTAQIEPGNGEPSVPGTVAMQSGGTFTVSGAFTYIHPFSGTIGVRLFWAGSGLLGTWPTSDVEVEGVSAPDPTPPGRTRLRGQPILAATPRTGREPRYELAFRTTRQLPLTSSGKMGALIEAAGRTSPISSLVAHRTSTCYVAHVDLANRHKLRPGTHYPFALTVDEGSTVRYRSQAVFHRFASLSRMRRALSRQLGCG